MSVFKKSPEEKFEDEKRKRQGAWFQSKDAKKAMVEAWNEDTLITDDMIREYIDRYYALLRDVLSSPDPKVWNAYEYQSQQLISVLSLEKIDLEKVECWTVKSDKVKIRDCSRAKEEHKEGITDQPRKWVKPLFDREIISLKTKKWWV